MGEGERRSRLDPRIGVHIALFRVCRGYCYWPECPHPVQKLVDGEPVVDVHIAHIHAEKPDGARWDETLSVEERRSFANLLLMCGPHHKIVDRKNNEEEYPAPLLRKWKTDREGPLVQALHGIPDVTDEGLPAMVREAQDATARAVDTVIAEMQFTRADVAELLRTLRDAAFDLPRTALNLDAIEMLVDASTMLGHLPHTSEELMRAADMLKGFPAAVERMLVVLDQAPVLGGWADALEERVSTAVATAGQRFQTGVEDMVRTQLLVISGPAVNPKSPTSFSSADAAHRTSRTAGAVREPSRAHDRWKYFRWGAFLGGAGLLTLLLGAHWLVDYLHL